jgi:hypothetical protein
VLGELVLAERAGEKAAVVLSALQVDDVGASKLGLGEEQSAPFSG